MTREELTGLGRGLRPLDEECRRAVLEHWDGLAKPLDALGQYEKIIACIGGILRKKHFSIAKRALIVFLSDNGIVDEGVSQSDVSVTHKVACSMANGTGCVSLMARRASVDVSYVDVGMKGSPVPGIIDRRVRCGTRDFLLEDAMTEEETLKAISVGYDVASGLIDAGNTLILLGEMGVGNTTTSTAIGCALLGCGASGAVGCGSGLSDAMKAHKADVIDRALALRSFDRSDPLSVLCSFGGYDIAAMTGAILACAVKHVPAVMDGLITLSALLVAERLFPGIREVCICSHVPREPMGRKIMLMGQLDVCLAVYDGARSFAGIGMDAYGRF